MNFSSFLSAVAAPNDLWTILMNWIKGSVGNLGWTILLLTILVKLVTTPLDFMVKLTTKKQTLVQQKCAPQIAKLRKKYGGNEQAVRAQTTSLYKREGLKMGTGCIVMLVNMILTCVIFFTFYATLRKVSAYEAIHQYEQVSISFENASYQGIADHNNTDIFTTAEQTKQWAEKYSALDAKGENRTAEEQTEWAEMKLVYDASTEAFAHGLEKGKEAAIAKWDELKQSWLWVDNIWVADATTRPFPTYENLKKMASDGGKYYKNYVEANISEQSYNNIASIVTVTNSKNNGYYILAVLAGVITLAQQLITDFHNKLKNKKANKLAKATNSNANAMSMKIMKIIMPIIMVMFVLSSSASFGIYILASNIAAILFGEISTIIVDKMTKKKREEVEAELEKEANRLIKKGHLQG